jgi:single-stranded-DNA-specific exonuclease
LLRFGAWFRATRLAGERTPSLSSVKPLSGPALTDARCVVLRLPAMRSWYTLVMKNALKSAKVEPEIPQIVAEILASRGMTPQQMGVFLYPDYERDLHDPLLMSDMGKAVERILAGVATAERVVVYGDYDIDGITASAVLIESLSGLGLEVSSYIPDRFEEGYGINQAALEQLQLRGAQLVISVDCGITSVEEAAWAREHGLDLIITDHHAVPAVLPDAIAVVNPKRPGDIYPFKELAGVGVAFKLAQALQQATGKPEIGQEKWLLDLVAMGTICDVVPLVGENRALASYGLKVLRRTRRVGLRALAEVGGVDIAKISAHEVGFVLGPRMNAAGRLEHAARSLELVLTAEVARAEDIAAQLEELNQARRADQAAILAKADVMAEQYAADRVLVLAGAEWSHGVVGIVASKLAEKWQKPVLLGQVLGDKVKGSARSVPGFNIVEALRSQEALLERFGGHFFAAGYTFAAGNLDELRRGLNAYYDQVMEAGAPAAAALQADIRRRDLAAVDAQLLEHLAMLEPFGNSNQRPLVGLDSLEVVAARRVGTDRQHLSLRLKDRLGSSLGVIGFGLAQRYGSVKEGDVVSVLGTLNNNEFQGKTSVQMVLSELLYE